MKAATWQIARRTVWVLAVTGGGAAVARTTPAQQAVSAFRNSFEATDASPLPAQNGAGFSAQVVGGPDQSVALDAKAGVGFSGLRSLRYAGSAGGAQQLALFDVSLPVHRDTQLSYMIFPERVPGDLRNPANYVAVDLLFDDGSRLATRGAIDQYRIGAGARAQGDGHVLYPNQWNRVVVDVGKVAAGRVIRRIVLDHDGPAAHFEGFIDDLRVGLARPDHASDPADLVDTRRGSNANGRFSRGNTFPAVAVPHGLNFWTPVTDASGDWLYQYQASNGPDNRPRLEALSLSHEPSPWMGDRQTFQLMPEANADGQPILDRARRAASFSHADEIAHAYTYQVTLDDGIVAQIAPTDHAAMFRFRFPGARAQLLFDNINDHGGITLNPGGRSFSGWSDVKSSASAGAGRLFFYGVVDQPVLRSGHLTGPGRDRVAAWFGFDTAQHKVVNLRLATSLISLAQAKHNLALEIAPHESFEQVRERARQQWDALLGRVRVTGASHGELTTLYSSLYRAFLYPNEAFENTGTAAAPVYRYASPFSPPVGPPTATQTGKQLVTGQPYVNNGLWDTYRTAWPLYALLTPREDGRMIDGFVQQYRDGGWIARWSSPSYADLMVGTSADVAFADAWLKGVHDFDVRSFYQAALKDATVVSPNPGTGRKGLGRSIFVGYTDTDTPEGLSWSTAGDLNDFGIGNLAAALAQHPPKNDPYAAHYADDARYFRSRALDYVNLFDPAVGFFVGRNASGQWRVGKSHFDPIRWGGDYTETDAWNMAFDAPEDGAGLAALYGGRAALAAKLDAFFATPGNFHVGSYGKPIHEMLEARDVRMGQYGHSNQPSHHIIYMYDYTGQPWKTQDKVRDVLARLYVGSDIGQGYPGDEDNGEMSSWYVFSAMGFYPLRMGTAAYVIGAPYFPHMDIALENGRHLVINAPAVSDTNRYIQSLTVNGKPWQKLSLPHALLEAGATLDFMMGPKPSRWGSAVADLPPSLTRTGRPQPLRDISSEAQMTSTPMLPTLAALTDNNSTTSTALAPGTTVINWHFSRPREVDMLTLTSAAHAAAPDGWTLEGSADGRRWQVLDQRHGERFVWPLQTRAFDLGTPGVFAWYRLSFAASHTARALGEIELLEPGAGPDATLAPTSAP